MLQGYAVTAVAWLYWSRTISNVSTKNAPSEKKPGPDSSAAMKRLTGYMKPYLGRFIVVLVLVVLSSCGALGNGVLDICCVKVFFCPSRLCGLFVSSVCKFCFLKDQ